MRRRRAVSSIRSGRAPVGYLNSVAIKAKNPFPHQEEVFDFSAAHRLRPFLSAGHKPGAPLPLVVEMVVVPMSAIRSHVDL
jgi:hypothetical protein